MKKQIKIPKFKNEDQEREFWSKINLAEYFNAADFTAPIAIAKIKKYFPIFKTHPHLVYLDNAATSLKPQSVIDKITEYYQNYSANIHRGIYQISEQATEEYEKARQKVADFIKARSAREIVFTSGATASINLVTSAWGKENIGSDDEIVLTEMEHHSNLVPWQELVQSSKFKAQSYSSKCKVLKNAKKFNKQFNNLTIEQSKYNLKFIPITADGQLDLSQLPKLITKKTKLLALTQISNVLGTVNPVKEIIKQARRLNPQIKVLADAAQSAPHLPIDAQDLDCDFLVFSGHKMMGPTGIGVLWAREEILKKMPPYQFGGGMIFKVGLYESTWADLPQKFEAGTPNIAGAIGLGAAIDFLQAIGLNKICRYELDLTCYALGQLNQIKGIEIYGPKPVWCGCCGAELASGQCQECLGQLSGRRRYGRSQKIKTRHCLISTAKNCKNRSGIISFNLKGLHPHDVAQILAEQGIALRAGHHCALPLHKKLGLAASLRASFYVYNTCADIDKLVLGLKLAQKRLGG